MSDNFVGKITDFDVKGASQQDKVVTIDVKYQLRDGSGNYQDDGDRQFEVDRELLLKWMKKQLRSLDPHFVDWLKSTLREIDPTPVERVADSLEEISLILKNK